MARPNMARQMLARVENEGWALDGVPSLGRETTLWKRNRSVDVREKQSYTITHHLPLMGFFQEGE